MIHRDETRVAVVNEEFSAEGGSGEVVDAAGTVCDVTKDEDGGHVGKGIEDVGENEGEHEEAFRELEGDAGGGEREDSVDGFVDFEGVVRGEEGDSGV